MNEQQLLPTLYKLEAKEHYVQEKNTQCGHTVNQLYLAAIKFGA